MNFLEAVKAMKEGKKVRRSCWQEGKHISKHGDAILWEEGLNPKFRMSQLEATDWQIVEEKKQTLSDKVVFSVEDIKEAIQDIKEEIDKLDFTTDTDNERELLKRKVKEIINKRIGKRLI